MDATTQTITDFVKNLDQNDQLELIKMNHCEVEIQVRNLQTGKLKRTKLAQNA